MRWEYPRENWHVTVLKQKINFDIFFWVFLDSFSFFKILKIFLNNFLKLYLFLIGYYKKYKKFNTNKMNCFLLSISNLFWLIFIDDKIVQK